MIIKCENCEYKELEVRSVELMDKLCPACNEWNSLIVLDALVEQDEPSDSEEIKKEIDKDYVA